MESGIKKKVYSDKKPEDQQNLKSKSVEKLDAIGLANAIAKLVQSHHNEMKSNKKKPKKIEVEVESMEEEDEEGEDA